MHTAAIVLAAGASTRLGQPKQLIQVKNEFLVDRAVRLATEAGCAPVIVVLGAFAELIRREAKLDAQIAENNLWQEGMASSIRAGVNALEEISPTADTLLLMTCDQYAITVDDLNRLIAASASGNVAASAYAGGIGIPAVLPHRYFDELRTLTGDRGARVLLLQHAEQVIAIPCNNAAFDVDTPDDLLRL